MSPKKQFKWSSHNPVIVTALDLLEPQFILELGVGNFSTPLLLGSQAHTLWHVENHKPWLDHVVETFPIDSRSQFRYHEISDRVNKSTPWSALPADLQMAQQNYYTALGHEISQMDLLPRLLFVDHFTCVRTLSINRLANQFDWIIYHDAETPEVYGYQDIDPDLYDGYDGWVLKTASSWTGMLIRKGQFDRSSLSACMLSNSAVFGQRFGRSKDEFEFVPA